mmetsp:Transcript_205/g.254  ORF Transcript_205/g.254 Transcript_205/m.254 type:complete len:284 (+) Transcript_205:2-853(+)
MEYMDGSFPLNQVKELDDQKTVYVNLMDILARFAHHGLIHGDYNEFNIMINNAGKITIIDFPQMVSVNHPNARMYFERDVNCIRRFFRKRFSFTMDYKPSFEKVIEVQTAQLDKLLQASGFTKQMSKTLDRFILSKDQESDESSDSDASDVENDTVENEDGNSSTAVNATDTQDGTVDDTNKAEKENEAKTKETDAASACETGEANDNASVAVYEDDSPNAYLQHDGVANYHESHVSYNEFVRRRVKREMGRKKGGKKQAIKTSRNVVKNREKRRVKSVIREY